MVHDNEQGFFDESLSKGAKPVVNPIKAAEPISAEPEKTQPVADEADHGLEKAETQFPEQIDTSQVEAPGIDTTLEAPNSTVNSPEGTSVDATAQGGQEPETVAQSVDRDVAPSSTSAEPASAPVPVPSEAKAAKFPTAGWVAVAIATLILGLLVGRFVLGSSGLGAGNTEGQKTISQDKVDTVVGTYAYNGQTKDITAKEVLIQMNGTLEGAATGNGSYNMPSADAVLNYARTQVLLMEADKRGIKVTDDDLNAYLQETYGVPDIKSVAESYGMDEASIEKVLSDSCKLQKLKDSVADGSESPSEPPEAPPMVSTGGSDSSDTASNADNGNVGSNNAETDETQMKRKEYADYIIALAGSEWDKDKGTWASHDGVYATTLAKFDITPEGATYEAALEAYYVAYEKYAQTAGGSELVWQEFMQDVLSKASVSINTLLP